MSHFFTDSQLAALAALCDTFLPSLEPPPGADEATAAYFRRSAADLDLASAVAQIIHDYATPAARAQTGQLLKRLASPAGTLLLTGYPRKFADLPFETREKVLQRWSVSPIGSLRQAFQGIKRLTHSLFFSILDKEYRNPNWAAIGYPGPPPIPPPPDPAGQPQGLPLLDYLTTRLPDYSTNTIDCDVVIVGSGAGGGVVAGILAQAGYHVVVLEKGGYAAEADFHRREFDSYRTLYENAGSLASEDLGIVVLAGSTLGGGTTINWTASFRTPDYVLAEWEREHRLTGFSGPGFQAALDAVCLRAGVSTAESHCNPQSQALFDGCKKLGYHTALIPRNVRGCHDCGWCCFGCPHGAKQSVLKTWLQDAVGAGAEIIVNCKAERILIENGRAVGVAAIAGWPALALPLTVRARLVVVAAGALHSPALLIRSGLQNPNLGRHLRLHPTTSIRGEMPFKTEPWRGVMMAVYSDEFGNLDGNHYGVKLETPPAHPGLLGFGLPWRSAQDYKTQMTRAAQQALIIAICRDRGSGRIEVDQSGRPRIYYKLSPPDARHLQRGIEAALRVAAAAGAVEVGTLHTGLGRFRLNGNAADFENYLRRVRRAGMMVNKIGLFSAHQMGTCRMGGERASSVLNAVGETWEVRNLYVADASTFPTASGVNPMITIQAIAYYIAQHIKTRLR